MKVAILGENKPGFIQPMSLGLTSMLTRLGVESQYFPDGLALLNYQQQASVKNRAKMRVKKTINRFIPQRFVLQQNVTAKQLKVFEAHLPDFDLIVVVCHLPTAFINTELAGIEKIRTMFELPIMLYQNYYLATRGKWYKNIVNPANYGGGRGIERYDWYLAASIVSEYPLTGVGHPCSVIGHDLVDDSLCINAGIPFKVLLDFERKGFEKYRRTQLRALAETNTPYTQLSGRYSQQQIRALYCEHSALFLSFRESFGLPIVENQLCGNFIFSPFKHWTPSHFIGKSVYDRGEGDLGRNFRIYDNDVEKLKAQLIKCREHYQPQQVRDDFAAQYPQLYHGDLDALQAVLDKVSSGEIHGRSHLGYEKLNAGIVGE
ncbi:MAG: hypothetical protein HRT35_02495 [Algicola sp.]|nr:hypothetical protein [Algicola sp.]